MYVKLDELGDYRRRLELDVWCHKRTHREYQILSVVQEVSVMMKSLTVNHLDCWQSTDCLIWLIEVSSTLKSFHFTGGREENKHKKHIRNYQECCDEIRKRIDHNNRHSPFHRSRATVRSKISRAVRIYYYNRFLAWSFLSIDHLVPAFRCLFPYVKKQKQGSIAARCTSSRRCRHSSTTNDFLLRPAR